MPCGMEFGVPKPPYWRENATTAVTNGTIPESRINSTVLRVMTPYFHLNQDQDSPKADAASAAVNTDRDWYYDFEIGNITNVRSEGHTRFIRESALSNTILRRKNMPMEPSRYHLKRLKALPCLATVPPSTLKAYTCGLAATPSIPTVLSLEILLPAEAAVLAAFRTLSSFLKPSKHARTRMVHSSSICLTTRR